MYFNPNYKDTYVKLDGETVFLDASTKIVTDNFVIREELSMLLLGEKQNAVKTVCFCPFDAAASDKVIGVFGAVVEDKEDSYLLEVTSEAVTVYSNSERGFLYSNFEYRVVVLQESDCGG